MRSIQSIANDLNRQFTSQLVHEKYPNATPISIIITHYARPSFIQRAEKAGHIVVQSYEW